MLRGICVKHLERNCYHYKVMCVCLISTMTKQHNSWLWTLTSVHMDSLKSQHLTGNFTIHKAHMLSLFLRFCHCTIEMVGMWAHKLIHDHTCQCVTWLTTESNESSTPTDAARLMDIFSHRVQLTFATSVFLFPLGKDSGWLANCVNFDMGKS